jgi:voltage-gated potassium channel Kch
MVLKRCGWIEVLRRWTLESARAVVLMLKSDRAIARTLEAPVENEASAQSLVFPHPAAMRTTPLGDPS